MPRKSCAELLQAVNQYIVDNDVGDITPGELRNILLDTIETFTPAYGAIQKTGPSVIALTGTPTLIGAYDVNVAENAPEFVVDLVGGSVTRQLNNVAGATVQVIASGFFFGQNGVDVTVRVYKNGQPTPYFATVNSFGNNNPVGFNIAGLTYDSADAEFDLRASASNNGNFTFREVFLLCTNVPVRSYV